MKNSTPLAGWSFWLWKMGYEEEPPMPNAQCPMPNAQCPMPNAQCPMPNAQCPMPNAPIETFTTIPDSE